MVSGSLRVHFMALLGLTIATALTVGAPAQANPFGSPGGPVAVPQGPNWTPVTRLQFYSQDQGSQIMPLSWLEALKQPNGKPFLGSQGFMVSAFSEDPLLSQVFLTDFVATPEIMQAMYEADPRPPAYLPVLETLEDENIAAFAAAGADADPMPAIPEMGSVWEAWGNAVTLIGQGGDTAANAFTNAQQQIITAISGG